MLTIISLTRSRLSVCQATLAYAVLVVGFFSCGEKRLSGLCRKARKSKLAFIRVLLYMLRFKMILARIGFVSSGRFWVAAGLPAATQRWRFFSPRFGW